MELFTSKVKQEVAPGHARDEWIGGPTGAVFKQPKTVFQNLVCDENFSSICSSASWKRDPA
jgi:hypothetical protein